LERITKPNYLVIIKTISNDIENSVANRQNTCPAFLRIPAQKGVFSTVYAVLTALLQALHDSIGFCA
jgi:hypothetical protein